MGPYDLAVYLLTAWLVLSGVASQPKSLDLRKFERLAKDAVNTLKRCPGFNVTGISYVFMDASKADNYVASGSTDGPLRADDLLCIGGATQAFTGVLLYKLLESNENYTIDTPIQDILERRVALPDFYRSNNINLKDIMTMRSGLAGMDIVPIVHAYNKRTLQRSLRYAPVVAPFREKIIHNEVLFALMEEVIEKLGGDTYAKLLKQHIFDVLHMNQTVVISRDELNLSRLYPGEVKVDNTNYNLPREIYSGLELISPAAGICTSARDMVQWVRFVLDPKRFEALNIVSEDLLKETFKLIFHLGDGDDPQTKGYRFGGQKFEIPVASYIREGRAFGWITGSYKGHSFVSQDGSLTGYQTLATFIPELQHGVYVSFPGDNNDKSFAAKVLLNQLGLDMLSGPFDYNYIYKICQTLDQYGRFHKPKEIPRHKFRRALEPNRPLQDYEGVFKNYAYGMVKVMYNASGNENLEMTYGKALYVLYAQDQNDTFAMSGHSHAWHTTSIDENINNPNYLVFNTDPRDPEGRITEVEIAGFDMNHDPIFAINPRAPRVDGEEGYQAMCSASGLYTSAGIVFLLASIVLLR